MKGIALINKTFTTGTVVSTNIGASYGVGGLVGQTSTLANLSLGIFNSFSLAAVSSTSATHSVGGLIGAAVGSGTMFIMYSYSAGYVSNVGSNIGGLSVLLPLKR